MANSSAPGSKRQFRSLEVGGQNAVVDARLASDPRHHLGGIGQLRHPFGRDEAGRLDLAKSGARQDIDQCDLVFGGNDRLFILQPVSGADLIDANARPHPAASTKETRTEPPSTAEPTEQATDAMTPSRGAVKLVSIFMASMMPRLSP